MSYPYFIWKRMRRQRTKKSLVKQEKNKQNNLKFFSSEEF